MYNLTIVTPTINSDKILKLYHHIEESVTDAYTFELIAVGPELPLEELHGKPNFKFYVDKGCPSRAFQLGTTLGEGDYVALFPDDAKAIKNSLKECLDLAYSLDRTDGIIVKYSEGVNYTGTQHEQPLYWTAKFHDDMKHLDGILPEWRIAPMFMYNMGYFRELGGLDCRFEHTNLNTHDFAFRLQKNGGQLHDSPGRVVECTWNPAYAQGILFRTYIENDEPLLKKMYTTYDPDRIKIAYDNWMNADPVWKRRHG